MARAEITPGHHVFHALVSIPPVGRGPWPGVAAGVDLADLAREVEPLHPEKDTFPGEVFLELAADASVLVEVTGDPPAEDERYHRTKIHRRDRRRSGPVLPPLSDGSSSAARTRTAQG